MGKLHEGHLRQALDVKRGLKRLRDIPAADRDDVERTLHLVRDGEWSELAADRENATRQPRSSRFTHAQPRLGRT